MLNGIVGEGVSEKQRLEVGELAIRTSGEWSRVRYGRQRGMEGTD